jgi:hypothetical protein
VGARLVWGVGHLRAAAAGLIEGLANGQVLTVRAARAGRHLLRSGMRRARPVLGSQCWHPLLALNLCVVCIGLAGREHRSGARV